MCASLISATEEKKISGIYFWNQTRMFTFCHTSCNPRKSFLDGKFCKQRSLRIVMMFNYIIAGVHGAWDSGLSDAYLHAPDVFTRRRSNEMRWHRRLFFRLWWTCVFVKRWICIRKVFTAHIICRAAIFRVLMKTKQLNWDWYRLCAGDGCWWHSCERKIELLVDLD